MKTKQNGKGSKRRPTDERKFRANWGNIFGDPLPIELKPFDSEPTVHQPRPKKI